MKKTLLVIALLSLFVVGVAKINAAQPVGNLLKKIDKIENRIGVKPTSTPPIMDLACMQTAVDKRDTAIIAAFSNFTSTTTSALGMRKQNLVEAWKLTDKKARRDAIKRAWNFYTTSVKIARRAFNASRKAAWKQFYTDRKSCKGINIGDDAGTEGHDINL